MILLWPCITVHMFFGLLIFFCISSYSFIAKREKVKKKILKSKLVTYIKISCKQNETTKQRKKEH